MEVETEMGGASDIGPSMLPVSSEPHEMRITDHGKIHSFVSFALKFLQENPQRPLVFHTLPIAKNKSTSQPTTDVQPPATSTEIPPSEEPPKKRRKLATPVATIPRLVTVVEIVKREYGKWAVAHKASDGGPVEGFLRTGLHQYNELTTLEELGISEPQEQEQEPDGAERLRQALEGKNFLKQKFTPHLKVTLSVSAQPRLEEKGSTHQPPPPIQKSRHAKARERKQQKKRELERTAE